MRDTTVQIDLLVIWVTWEQNVAAMKEANNFTFLFSSVGEKRLLNLLLASKRKTSKHPQKALGTNINSVDSDINI